MDISFSDIYFLLRSINGNRRRVKEFIQDKTSTKLLFVVVMKTNDAARSDEHGQVLSHLTSQPDCNRNRTQGASNKITLKKVFVFPTR